ncbi:TRAP transporter substrate-binding protein [Rhizobium mesosinicum]|uniref:TRAP transporter substrate-binding protein n=1 Tax=Rhizobium mesosinicum TaxID=335017 RepID=A0ABS7GP10_9HYPH|nr:TRAP transporter substrate-binding protein [Rhizobium mesosinicum]MBW9051145.1 TRAP transporter substrate-binding protein [Rhizobium mesosinicum]
MMMNRRTILKTGGIAALALATPAVLRAQGAEFRYRLGHPYPEDLPVHSRAKEAAEKIRNETGGRVEIGVYGNSALGGDTQMISQVRSGALQFYSGAGVIVSSFVPLAAISGVGFAFKDYPTIWSALDGSLGDHVRRAFASAGLHALDKCWDTGFRQTSSSTRAITKPEDFKGFKIRVPVSRAYTSLFEALGASPTSVNLAEVYSALQTKIVEGQENSIAVFSAAKFYEVQKFLSLTNHMWDGSWLLANGRAWEALPEDIRAIVATNFNEAAVLQRQDSEARNAQYRAQLGELSIQVNEVEAAPFKQVLRDAGYYQQWAERYGADAWSSLEEYAGKLA